MQRNFCYGIVCFRLSIELGIGANQAKFCGGKREEQRRTRVLKNEGFAELLEIPK
jgi:hypothetical protein